MPNAWFGRFDPEVWLCRAEKDRLWSVLKTRKACIARAKYIQVISIRGEIPDSVIGVAKKAQGKDQPC